MHGGGDGEILVQRLLLRTQIGQMLEVVGVDVAMRQQLVRVHRGRQLDDLEPQVGCLTLHEGQDLGMRHGVGRDLERRVLRQGGAGEGERQGGSDRRPRQAGGQG
jgi:hypothetical protein